MPDFSKRAIVFSIHKNSDKLDINDYRSNYFTKYFFKHFWNDHKNQIFKLFRKWFNSTKYQYRLQKELRTMNGLAQL